MKIIVLAGGYSTERDISIVTGTQVAKGLIEAGHEAVLLDSFFGTEETDLFRYTEKRTVKKAALEAVERTAEEMRRRTPEVAQVLADRASRLGTHVLSGCRAADVVFLALHGLGGEDGRIQAMFEVMGIPFTGSGSVGSALAMDKGITRKILAGTSVPMAEGFSLWREDVGFYVGRELPAEITPQAYGFSWPCVVKPACGGSSVGVSIVHDEAEYKKALEEAFRLEEKVVVERYIKGREFSIGVLDGKALPIIEIAPLTGFYDYENKYKPGATKDTCPAELLQDVAERMQRTAEDVHRLLELGAYSRMDFLMDEDGNYYCLEANTLPGMTPTSLLPQEAAVVGMDFPSLCEKLIELSVKK
ncbi:MAG: D-alanine--D-alanine ligase [Lachnospiraceae bacterium]|nr:D-alanine--D-alanine ligase [Lachnospiraceae bacterium]